MRYDPAHPDPTVDLGRRLADLKERAVRADQRPGRSHVQMVRTDDAAPSTTSTTRVGIYALTVVGLPDTLCAQVDVAADTGTSGTVGIAAGDGTLLASLPFGGPDLGRKTLGPVPVGGNDLSVVLWRTAGAGAVSARLIAAWVPDV